MVRTYVPAKRGGYIWGFVIIALVIAASGMPVVLTWLAASADGGRQALAIGATAFAGFMVALFVYLLYGLKTLRYDFAAEGLTVHWGIMKVSIPYSRIEDVRVVPGTLSGLKTIGVGWPGCYIGIFSLRGIGRVEAYATRMRGNVVLVGTGRQTYLLSPDTPEEFESELRAKMKDAPAVLHKEARAHAPFWADPLAVLLVVGNLAVLAGAILYLLRLLPTLPARIPAHWDFAGRINRYSSPQELFMLPLVGAVGAIIPLMIGLTQKKITRTWFYILAGSGLLLQILFLCILWGWVGMIRQHVGVG